MRWNLIPSLSKIHLDNSWSVDGEPFIWVDHNTEQARVGVDQLSLVSGLQVPEDRGFIEKSQVGHILTLLKLWRINLSNFLRFEGFFL